MARPLEFDRDHALDAALNLFWRQGYLATSLSQLLEVMAISRSSFYAAFGDKRALYVEVLQLFADRTLAILQRCRSDYTAVEAVPAFFRHTALEVPARRTRRGCMMVNTVLELADVDDDLSRVAVAHLSRIETAFEGCVREAQALGVIPEIPAPKDAARYLMLVNQGIRVVCREGRPRRELATTINTSLSLLGLPVA